jgi:hypothetical protein
MPGGVSIGPLFEDGEDIGEAISGSVGGLSQLLGQ